MATFAFLSLLLFLWSRSQKRRRGLLYIGSLLMVGLALAEKESAGPLCVLIPATYALLTRPYQSDPPKSDRLIIVPYFALAALYLGVRRIFAGDYFASEGV